MDGALSRRLPLLAFAYRNLTRARARSILAMAGITIGVIAIASLGMFGAAFEQSILDQTDDYTRTVSVSPGEDADFQRFDRDHVAAVQRYSEEPVYTVQREYAQVSAFQSSESAAITSISDPSRFVAAEKGSIPAPWRSGALVGPDLADSLGVTDGDSLTINGQTFRVAAVLEDPGQVDLLGVRDAVLLPPEQMSVEGYSSLFIQTSTPNEAFETADRLRTELNDRRQLYAVSDAENAIEGFNEQMATINTFLLGVGGVSLLVASVSILNVMLMSTIERKEEIGVLRAVGYHRLDVLRLMLNEAALLGVFGALAGVVLSVLLGMVINAELLSDPLAFTAEALQYVAVGFVFGTLASFLSGLYPAWKAANARPVEALRD